MKAASFHFLFASIALLLLGGCANSEIKPVSNNDVFKDPDTKRLETQEGMTKVTRELSVNY